ncbi:mucin-13 [Desmodus rotundus]|uniref:mucin-13 n=1 Tax=Desmodus rotundus TaxID=9430 RepID=UPI0039E4D632
MLSSTATSTATTTTETSTPRSTATSTATATETSTPAGTTASIKNPCQDDPCSGGSSCVNLISMRFCLCMDGYYYNSSSCKKGKVFPGIIQVKIPDTSDLENEKSINYENLYIEVMEFFEGAFTSSDYGQTVIHQVRISAPARSQMRAGDKVVDVTVVNLFAEDTKENETTISSAIHEATSNNTNFITYTKQDRCEFYGCVKTLEQDDCSNGFQCKCRPGYERPNPYTATCLPSSPKCPDACNSEHNMQCLVKDSKDSDCVCLAGYKKDDHGKCQACAFGYNGVNCEDNFQLILTVVGTIAGILILGMVIALIFMRSKKTKDIEEQNLIENSFQNLKLQQTTGFSSPAGGSIFPKITAGFPRGGGMQNPYENPRGVPYPDY